MAQDFGTLGRLVVSLEANMAQFEQSLNKAEYQMQQFGQRIDAITAGASKALLGLAATAAAAFSFDAIVGGIEKAVSAAAELEKMSQKAGVSAEALSGLKGAAKLSGTALEEVVGGLQKLDKAMIQAESGSTKQVATFKALGISMADLKSLTPDEVMLKVAKSLDQVESGSVRVAVAQILLGKAGANLLPMLHDLARQGEIVGKVTDEQTAMAEKYERSLIALDNRKKALYNTIAMALLPTMSDFVDAFAKSDSMVGRLNKTAKDLAADNTLQDWARAAARGVAFVIDAFDGLSRVIQIVGSGLGRFMADMKSILDFGSGIGQTLIKEGSAGVGKRWDRLQLELSSHQETASANFDQIIGKQFFGDKLQAEFDSRDAGQKKIAAAPRNKPLDLGGVLGKGSSAFENFLQELDRQAIKIEQGLIPELTLKAQQLAEKESKDPSRANAGIAAVQKAEETRFLNDYTRALKRQEEAEHNKLQLVGLSAHEQELVNIQNKAALDLSQKIEAEEIKLGSVSVATRELMAAASKNASDKMIADANARYDAERKWAIGSKTAIDSYMEAITNAAAQSNRLFTDAFKGMEDALVKFVKTGKLDFKSLADQIITDLIRIQVQNSIMKPLVGTKDDPGILSQGLSWLGNSVAGMFGGGRAAGGDVLPGQYYVVGENGPEILVPNTGGTVIPNGGGAASGVSNQPVNINFNVQAIDAASFRSTLAANRNVIVGVVREAFTRRAITSPI